MAKFTYLGVDGAADPNGTQAFGQYFEIGKAVEVDDERVIAKLAGHPHFKASDKEAKKAAKASEEANPAPVSNEPPQPNEKAYGGGAKAFADGKERSVPPAYRGKPEEAAWLAGYDDAKGA